ncbi:hypothetical protein EYF80_065987 [Liparis tanakae]|uniref:Uncharacterized protein n=1 Tax=Liparis tanakae TaxID=230148 RepID=A0A4Z2E5M4_9TELE|nr:hypothetical protein EYF80_065987 [Liparis tanakae]
MLPSRPLMPCGQRGEDQSQTGREGQLTSWGHAAHLRARRPHLARWTRRSR